MLRYGCVCADAVGASVGKCRMVTCVHTHVEFPPQVPNAPGGNGELSTCSFPYALYTKIEG